VTGGGGRPHWTYAAPVDPLPTLVALAILWLLARVARVAWRQRALTFAIWRAVRPRHVAGALALLVLVGGVATALLTLVPATGLGLGHLVGLTGNAIFAPLEAGMARTGPPTASGPDWVLAAGTTVFLGLLAALLPWLAFVEEEVFRAGLEGASVGRVATASLTFGLAHLLMLVPLAAALAIGVAGGVYATVYRRAFTATAEGIAPGDVPLVALRAYRPGRRGAAALARIPALVPANTDPARGSGTAQRPTARDVHRARQAAAAFRAAVWHATFNTSLVVLLWLLLVATALSPPMVG
jgi:hypothetical protein